MLRFRLLAAVLLCVLNLRAEPPPLLPRELFLAAPERTAPLLSPDGARLAWMAVTNGQPALFVRTTGAEGDRVALLLRRPVADLRWTPDSRGLLYAQDTEEGVPHVFLLDLETGGRRDLTPFVGVPARLLAVSLNEPEIILTALLAGERGLPQPHAVNLATGALVPAAENPGGFTAWHADHRLRLRLAETALAGGGGELHFRPDEQGLWQPLYRWGADDTARFLGFTPDDAGLWLATDAGANAQRLLQIQLDRSEARVLAADPRFDVARVLLSPRSNVLDAVLLDRARGEWRIGHAGVQADFAALRQALEGDFDVIGRTADDRQWVVAHLRDDEPAAYLRYDRETRRLAPLYSTRPRLAGQPLARTRVAEFAARDGRPLLAYLTLPRVAEPRNLPLVLLVHPGPWARDRWGFDPEVQWLANRGYAVLQVNYRGSAGLGRDHLRAGFREWGGAMQDDLTDARAWAVKEGVADPARIAIMGQGYGGYAALMGLARTPELFAAGVSIGGPVNLPTFIRGIPESLPAVRALVEERVGHPERDAAMLRERSPLTHAEAVRRPAFLAQPAGDPQVRTGETDEFIAVLRKNGVPNEYLLFPDESQGVVLPANRRRLWAAIEAFLAQQLGGRAEPPAVAEAWARLRR